MNYIKSIILVDKYQDTDIEELTTFNSFEKSVKQKGDGFKFQKYMGLMLIDSVEKGSANQKSTFATELIRYAASNTNVSSFFVKVS